MKNALIFGMDGFVGKYMAEELRKNGYAIFACGLNGENSNENYAGWYNCDLLDMDHVKNIIAEVNPTHIINLAGQSNVGVSWRIPRRTIEANVCGPINIMEAVWQCEADCHILMIGSSEEYGKSEKDLDENSSIEASNPYGISKEMLEKICKLYNKRYNLKVHFVRPFNHTGIGQNDNFVIPSWCKQVAEITKSKKKGEMMVGNLEIVRDFSDVRDIVVAYRMVLESNDYDTVYNIGSGQPTKLNEILTHIISLSDQEITVKTNPKLLRPVENQYICCDNSLIREKLGWKPRYSIHDTIKEMFDYYLN